MNYSSMSVSLPSHKGRKGCVMKCKMMLVMMAVTAAAFVSYAGGPCCAAKAAKAEEAGAAVKASSISADAPALCGKCGQVAGSELCCKEGAAACPKCGMHAGSPGCMACCKAMKSGDKAAGCEMMKKMGCAPKVPEAAPAAEESAAPAE